MYQQPNYAPNVVNQTVDYGGRKWQGQPGGQWTDITDKVAAQDAQRAYQQATQTAISGLQTKKTDLAGQYTDLLKTVKGEYEPIINQATATAGAELSRRGLTPDSTLFQQQTQGALQPIYGNEAANAQQIGMGSVSDTNTLAQAIASLQAGAAGTASQLPLQFGQLALQQQQLPSQIALAQAQAANYPAALANALQQVRLQNQFQNVPMGNSLVNTLGNMAINPSMLTSTTGFANLK